MLLNQVYTGVQAANAQASNAYLTWDMRSTDQPPWVVSPERYMLVTEGYPYSQYRERIRTGGEGFFAPISRSVQKHPVWWAVGGFGVAAMLSLWWATR